MAMYAQSPASSEVAKRIQQKMDDLFPPVTAAEKWPKGSDQDLCMRRMLFDIYGFTRLPCAIFDYEPVWVSPKSGVSLFLAPTAAYISAFCAQQVSLRDAPTLIMQFRRLVQFGIRQYQGGVSSRTMRRQLPEVCAAGVVHVQEKLRKSLAVSIGVDGYSAKTSQPLHYAGCTIRVSS